jgi:carbonic anhydrase
MALESLLKGFADFRVGYYREHLDLFEKLATQGQSPKILIVGCSDARIDPGILTQTQPGDIFTVRNIAAMVPPALVPPDNERHGTSAGIEYAVRGLQVEHVVILGHALCGGIAALVDGDQSAVAHYDYVSTWTAIGRNMRDVAVHDLADRSRDEILRAVEQASVVNSVANLMTFPWLAERVAAGKLVLHAWWFNLTEGQLYAYNPDTAVFDAVTGLDVKPAVQKSTKLSAIKPERLLLTLANKKPAF